MTPFSPEKLVIFDYSGTLSLEAPRFARPVNLLSALAESGLAGLGVATPETFWGEIVGPTWTEASTTSIGYKRAIAQRIEARGPAPGVSGAEIAAASSRFVDLYLAHSRIDPLWRSMLENLAGNPGAYVVIATDHYAEATETIIDNLHSWDIPAGKAGEKADPGFPFFIANSADIGFWKADCCFWEVLKSRLPLKTVRSALIIDDFGFNEEQGDSDGERAKVEARQKETAASLQEIFQVSLTVIPFFLQSGERDQKKAGAQKIAETVRQIDRFLNSGDVTKDKMSKNECKPEIAYPCRWVYKVIGRDLSLLHSAVAEVLTGRSYAATPSRSSKGGAYHCLSVELTVESESVRVGFYEKLRRHPAAIMVL
jgi:putative lipoic acid-binding regulatory protein